MKKIPLFLLVLSLLGSLAMGAPQTLADNPSAPASVVKLIFIHHSTGENWLTDDYGDLGQTLGQNNYYVSDTNYGWGPDAIGDRTDIPDWLEWFRGEQSERYTQALFKESGQNSNYTRSLADPGGENEIILFKSCFPNSDLVGAPSDAPDPEGWLSVGHAKYVYNELLHYFASRPDKLFIVITAPPLSDATHAANARAFNEWLLNDWLRENNYTANNVAVFDFYNVLTGPNHHHRWNGAEIEHTLMPGANTAQYASAPGDDHPSIAGSRKATEEFIPLLNIFYHRWQANAPLSESPAAPVQPQPENASPTPAAASFTAVLDNFESDSANWQAFGDETGSTLIACSASTELPASGAQSLRVDFKVASDGWATCAYFYENTQNWSASNGLTFSFRADAADLPIHFDLYSGSDEARETYVYSFESSPASVSHWVTISVPWQDFQRVAWEENAGAAFAKPEQVSGLAFGFPAAVNNTSAGTIWVDDLQFGTQAASQPTQPATPLPVLQEAPIAPPASGLPFCGGAALLPLGLLGVIRPWRKK
jgi:hypothetical protein